MPWQIVFIFIILYLLAFFLGAALASFGNVVVWRLPRGVSFTRGRSQCPACGKTLAARDLVPVCSWLLLRGRCRACRARIPRRELYTELLGGLLSCAAFAVYGFTWCGLAACLLLLGLQTIALLDLDTMLIPDGLLLAPALALVFLLPEVSLAAHIIGIFAASVPLLLLALLTGGFGGGDIKLTAVCGLALGWQLTLFALFCGIVLGGAFALLLVARKKAGRRDAIPFGPALAAGCGLALLVGKPVLAWYIGLL